jgi:hypothetical protein
MELILIVVALAVAWIVVHVVKGLRATSAAEARVRRMSSKRVEETHYIATGYLAAARLGIIRASATEVHEYVAMAHSTLRRAALENGVPARGNVIVEGAEKNVQEWIKNIDALPSDVRKNLPAVFSAPLNILQFGRQIGLLPGDAP